MHAPVVAALLIALVVGALAQRARLCMAGGLRDVFLFRDFKLLYGFVAIFVVVLVGNLINGTFKLGFTLQPVAHSSHVWNFLGMALVGWGSVLARAAARLGSSSSRARATATAPLRCSA